jgi:hypothetical protein
MNSQIGQQTASTAKNLAQQIAKQMRQEPLEILKDVKEQTTGTETTEKPGTQPSVQPDQQKQVEQQKKLQDQMKSNRMFEALQREMEDIRKQNLFKNLQERIAQGEIVPLEDFPELSMEQKQVLLAQTEAVKRQRQQQTQSYEEPPVIHSKPSRRFGAGQKQEAEKQQTRVEKPVPPSG